MSEYSKKLFPALLAVQKDTTAYLQKANKNTGQSYNYVSSSQVLSNVREAMDKHGVLLMPEIIGQEIEQFTTKNGALQFFTKVQMAWHWVHAETGEFFRVAWEGQGVDNSEKGIGKAITYAEKYIFLKTFHIATDQDDPDSFEQKIEMQKPTPKMTDEQRQEISDIITQTTKDCKTKEDWTKAKATILGLHWYKNGTEEAKGHTIRTLTESYQSWHENLKENNHQSESQQEYEAVPAMEGIQEILYGEGESEPHPALAEPITDLEVKAVKKHILKWCEGLKDKEAWDYMQKQIPTYDWYKDGRQEIKDYARDFFLDIRNNWEKSFKGEKNGTHKA